jgi:hypothetical protein
LTNLDFVEHIKRMGISFYQREETDTNNPG